MTGKRFEFREVHNGGIIPKIWDNEKQKYLNLLESCNFLNELHKENKELKEKNKNLLVKLKHTCERINCSERLKEMMK